MKRIILLSLTLLFCSQLFAQPNIAPDKNTQMWNVANGYYGTINSNTIDACTALDTFKGTTAYLYNANWYRKGPYAFDSARVLAVNTSGIGPYSQPYSWGFVGRGTVSITANILKASTSSTVTPSVVLTPQQSPNGVNGWVNIPGVTALTVTPTSRTVAVVSTFNIADLYTPYLRLQLSSTDTSSGNAFVNLKPKTY